MGGWYKAQTETELHCVQYMEGFTECGEGMKALHTIEALEWDYRQRLGNIVLKHIRDNKIKPIPASKKLGIDISFAIAYNYYKVSYFHFFGRYS